MRSYNEYISVSHWLGVLALLFVVLFVSGIDNASWIWFGLVQAAVGLMQLLTGIHFASSKRSHPDWFIKRWSIYWMLTCGYFIVLVWLWQNLRLGNQWLSAWLFIIPWLIAIYQYASVSKLRKYYLKQSAMRLIIAKKI